MGLANLPKKELVAGIAEVIKYGVIYDKDLFRTLEEKKDKILNLDKNILVHIIKRSCEIKADVVSKDERESGLRSILNFGHTLGHAIETATDYKRYLHGEAVALGMCLEARLSQELEFIDKKAVVRIKKLVDSFGLPSALPTDIDIDRILSSMQLDKKAVAGALKFVLPERIGRVRIEEGIKEKIIKKFLKSQC